MTIWLTILGMALVTYSVRLLPLTTIREEALPTWVRRGLGYVPVAVLTAISLPEFLPSPEWFHFKVGAHLVAGTVAVVTAWGTRSTILTILAGLGVLILLN